MMILFLDDNENRHKSFQRNAIGFSTTRVHTAQEAIEAMRELDHIDLIMLDHDLNCETNNQLNDEEEDGRWVCKKMAEEQLHVETTVIIHSMNPIGAQNMESILRDAGYKDVHQICSAWTMLSKKKDGTIKIDTTLGVSKDIRDYQ